MRRSAAGRIALGALVATATLTSCGDEPADAGDAATSTAVVHAVAPYELACEETMRGLGSDGIFADPPPQDLGVAIDTLLEDRRDWPGLAPGAEDAAEPGVPVPSVDDHVAYVQDHDRLWVSLDGEWVAYETLAWLEAGEIQGWGGGEGPGWGWPGGGTSFSSCPAWDDHLELRRSVAS